MNYKIQLRGPKIKKKLLWTTLSTEMKEHGFTMSSNVIERKFRNMKHQFLKIRDKNTKTGRGRQSWQYFNIMQDLFHDDTCVNPISRMASLPGLDQVMKGIQVLQMWKMMKLTVNQDMM